MFDKLKNMLSLDQWIKNFEGYLDARIELVKFDVKEALVHALSKGIFFIAIAIFALAGLVCLNFGLAYLLNTVLESPYAGFLLLAGFYFLIASIFFWMRNHQPTNQRFERILREALDQPSAESSSEDHEPVV